MDYLQDMSRQKTSLQWNIGKVELFLTGCDRLTCRARKMMALFRLRDVAPVKLLLGKSLSARKYQSGWNLGSDFSM